LHPTQSKLLWGSNSVDEKKWFAAWRWKQAVKHDRKRFPEDFMFQPSREEFQNGALVFPASTPKIALSG
jgi:hypothetical protein